MSRSPLMVILLAVFAGAAAGMAVQLFNDQAPAEGRGPAASGVSEAAHSEVENQVQRDADRIRDAEIAIEKLRSEISSLRDQLTAQAGKHEKFEEYMKEGRPAGTNEFTMVGPDGKPVKMKGGMRMPGAKLREELSLDSYQESELKQIAADYKKAMGDMFKPKTDGGGMSIGKIDITKIMKTRSEADERVKNLLSETQHEKFRKENYGAAIGLGGATSVSVSTTFESSEGK